MAAAAALAAMHLRLPDGWAFACRYGSFDQPAYGILAVGFVAGAGLGSGIVLSFGLAGFAAAALV